jgi:hypothetical protein
MTVWKDYSPLTPPVYSCCPPSHTGAKHEPETVPNCDEARVNSRTSTSGALPGIYPGKHPREADAGGGLGK